MTDYLDLIDPVELTEFARLAADDFDAQVQSLARFLPNRQVADIMYAYDKGVDVLVDEAQFRAFDAEAQIGRRPAASRITGSILPISRKIPLSEYAQLRLRNAANDVMVQQHFNDAARLARGIAARAERARGQLLETGKVTIDENGVTTEYDSGRAVGHTISTLASNDRWSAYSTADPISDVMGWSDLIYAATGVRPTKLLVSSVVMAHLQRCDAIRGAFVAAAAAPTLATVAGVRDAFVALASVDVEVYEAPAGLTGIMTSTKVTLVTESVPMGSTLYGIPVEATEPSYVGLSSQPGVVAGTWREHDPSVPWTKASALLLPVLASPDSTLNAQVIA
jgi:hypothetical protein